MKNKGEINLPAIILSVFGLFVLGLGISFLYFSVNGTNYDELYQEKTSSESISEFTLNTPEQNEIIVRIEGNLASSNLSKEEIKSALIKLKIYNLHNVPYTSDTPKIQIDVDEISYSVEVSKGKIRISDRTINNKDVIIKTTGGEISKMNRDENYAKESFKSGNSEFKPVANKFVLFSKGYLTLYQDLLENPPPEN